MTFITYTIYISVYIFFFRAAYSRGTDQRHRTNLISRNPLRVVYTKRAQTAGYIFHEPGIIADNPIAREDVHNRGKSREILEAINSEI